MSKEYWKEALNTAKEQLDALRIRLDALDAEREIITNEMVQLEQVVTSLTPLTSEHSLEELNAFLIENATELNLADACREVLKKNNRYMTPIEIRDTLAASGFDLTNYSNPLASIHGVLKRFVESGTAEKHEKDGATMYRSKGYTAVVIPASTSGRSTSAPGLAQQLAELARGKRVNSAIDQLAEMKRGEIEKGMKGWK